MSRGYDPKELEDCKSKECKETATVLVLRTIETEEVLIGYCSFHAVTANIYFGHNPQRQEVKGIRPC